MLVKCYHLTLMHLQAQVMVPFGRGDLAIYAAFEAHSKVFPWIQDRCTRTARKHKHPKTIAVVPACSKVPT